MWTWYWVIALLAVLRGGEPRFVMFFLYWALLIFVALKILQLLRLVRCFGSIFVRAYFH